MKIITLQMLLDKLQDEAKGNRGCGLTLLGILAAFLIVGGATAGFVDLLLPVALFGGGGLVFLHLSSKNKKHAQDKSFYIITKTCVNKHKESGGEDADACILTFADGDEHTIGIDDVRFANDAQGSTDEWLYNATQIGDQFYLVYLQNEKRPAYVLSQRFCQLDPTGFVTDNDCWYPKK